MENRYEIRLLRSIGLDPTALRSVFVRGLRLNYVVTGKGPAVILIHGLNMGWGQWYKTIPELSKHFTVYALDLPGSGGSTKIDVSRVQFQDQLVSIVGEFVAQLGLSSVSVMGHSVGGLIALQVGKKTHSLFRQVITVNSFGFSSHISVRQKLLRYSVFLWLIVHIFVPLNRRGMSTFFASGFFNKDLIDPLYFEYYYESLMRECPTHPFSLMSGLLKDEDFVRQITFTESDLAEYPLRVCTLWGAHDTMFPLKKQLYLLNKMKKCSILVFENSGHVPFFEETELFNTTVINILRT